MTTDAVEVPQRLSPAELRELFLFTDLTDDQLDWVQHHGGVVAFAEGEVVAA